MRIGIYVVSSLVILMDAMEKDGAVFPDGAEGDRILIRSRYSYHAGLEINDGHV